MAQVRVHELAKEFGVTSKVLLAKLAEMGEFVKSASSTVEPTVVKRLKDVYGEELRSMPYTPPMPDGCHDGPKVGMRPGVRPDMRNEPIQHQRRPRPGTIKRAPAKTSWDDSPFDDTARRIWMRYGLGDRDARLAMYLLEHGVLPEDLRLRLRGRSAASRLRGGESWPLLVKEMRELRAMGERPERQLPSTAVTLRRTAG